MVQAFIIDMGSTNGTFVNGIKVRSHGVAGMKWAYQLREGDQVRFGQLSYILQNSQERYRFRYLFLSSIELLRLFDFFIRE